MFVFVIKNENKKKKTKRKKSYQKYKKFSAFFYQQIILNITENRH